MYTRHDVMRLMPEGERAAVRRCLFNGEERQHFGELLDRLAERLDAMPVTYESRGERIAFLHWFTVGSDWWVIELDRGSPDDGPEDWQSQMFGLVQLNGWEPELGYISLPELLSVGAELDLYWTPVTLAEVKRQVAA